MGSSVGMLIKSDYFLQKSVSGYEIMSPTRTTLALLASLSLRIEAPLHHAAISESKLTKGKGWYLPPGAYTAREIMRFNAPLLETVLHHLGPSPAGEPSARDILLDNISSNLSLGDSASTLTIPVKNPSSAELAQQAEDIGKTLVGYARSMTAVEYDPNYEIRSPCEAHIWKQQAAQLLFGPRSREHLPQLFNEYLHQTVLLRDSLLPFKNYEDVIIPIEATEDNKKRGMRWIQPSRSTFLVELISKSLSQDALFKFAKALLAPSLIAENSYGFQYEHGLILPSFFDNSFRLFQFHPAVMDSMTPRVAFKYQLEDYYTAPRTEIISADTIIEADERIPAAEPLQSAEGQTEAAYVPLAKGSCTAFGQLQLSITRDNIITSIDLGQVFRGRRYAYPLGKSQGASANSIPNTRIHVHSAWKVLTESGIGLVTAKEGIHLIQARSSVELLALLGKLYPESVTVMKEGESLQAALRSGKGFSKGGRFIIQTNADAESIMPGR